MQASKITDEYISEKEIYPKTITASPKMYMPGISTFRK